MAQLFEKSRINSLDLANRAIRSATWAGVGDIRGYVTDRALRLYRDLGRGGIGLIITGYQHVMHNGQQTPFMIGNYEDGQIEGLARIAEVVHAAGGKVAAQLAHSGARANPALFREGEELWGPSAVRDASTNLVPKEMTVEEIRSLVQAYAAAARRSKLAGFDGVQLHAAHGYGINQFLSRAWNRRTDEYGGSLRDRYRFFGEVLQGIREAVGPDFPLMVKVNLHDFMDDGLVTEDMLQVVRWAVSDGVDAVEVSGGTATSPKDKRPIRRNIVTGRDEAYFADFAAIVKQAVSVPVIAVGGFRSLDVVEEVLAAGKADYVAMSRPFVREPGLLDRWRSGDTRRARCISCTQCYVAAMGGQGIHCVEDRKLQARLTNAA